MIQEELTHVSKEWDDIAVRFDRYVTPTANWALAKYVLELAGLKPGMDLLDVASGSGALALPAARKGARVLAIDISPIMIDRLKARAQEEGLSDLTGRVMDGHHLELDDSSFDRVGSQFGVTLLPDLQQGMKEMVRVTRPGGKVFVVSFGPIQEVEFIGLFVQAIKKVNPDFEGLSPHDPPLPFQVSGKGALRSKMEQSGLQDISIHSHVHELFLGSGKDMWNWVTSSNPIALKMISGLDPDQKILVQQILDEMIKDRSTDGEVAPLKASVIIGIGTKTE